MTIAGITAGPLSEVEHGRQLRRALIASTVGTTIEWYDFLLYGQIPGKYREFHRLGPRRRVNGG